MGAPRVPMDARKPVEDGQTPAFQEICPQPMPFSSCQPDCELLQQMQMQMQMQLLFVWVLEGCLQTKGLKAKDYATWAPWRHGGWPDAAQRCMTEPPLSPELPETLAAGEGRKQRSGDGRSDSLKADGTEKRNEPGCRKEPGSARH